MEGTCFLRGQPLTTIPSLPSRKGFLLQRWKTNRIVRFSGFKNHSVSGKSRSFDLSLRASGTTKKFQAFWLHYFCIFWFDFVCFSWNGTLLERDSLLLLTLYLCLVFADGFCNVVVSQVFNSSFKVLIFSTFWSDTSSLIIIFGAWSASFTATFLVLITWNS